jgi:4'-phosphopantetheinyl transferase
MEVLWLEQRAEDVPESDAWFSSEEMLRLGALNIAKRRADWRLGRWTAKCAVAKCLGIESNFDSLAKIEIVADASGAPRAFVSGRPSGVAISLSHRAGVGACAATASPATLGCDLELVELRSEAFLADYFTEQEHMMLGHAAENRMRVAAILWSAKESALKALGEGLRADTRSVTVTRIEDGEDWCRLSVSCDTGEWFEGWWREEGEMVRTMVAAPAAEKPIVASRIALSARAG